jgi:hypothetical protein
MTCTGGQGLVFRVSGLNFALFLKGISPYEWEHFMEVPRMHALKQEPFEDLL